MSHLLRVVAKRPCRLDRGELRRVSQDRRQLLIAYHLCCPRCGFVNAVFHQHQGQLITEHEDGERVSFSAPVRCVFCNVTLHVTDSVAELEEGGLQVEVIDRDRTHLEVIDGPAWAIDGHRGLLLVEAISEAWGVDVTDHGKRVWAQLAPVAADAEAARRTEAPGDPMAGAR